MDRHPDITDVLTRDRIVDLFATASNARRPQGVAVSLWRKLTGAALVRLGEAILGDVRPVALRTAGLNR